MIQIDKLPSPPGVALELLKLFSDPNLSLDDLQQVISVDPILTARIIKYANSPVFARRHQAETLRQAITLLGGNGVKMIALSFSLAETKSDGDAGEFDFEQFWSYSLATAVANKNLYESAGHDADFGFLVGLLLNVGQLAIHSENCDRYGEILERKKVNDLELLEIEQQEFGQDRYALTSEILQAWNLPDATIEATKDFVDQSNTDSFQSRSLRLASQISYSMLTESPEYEFVKTINAELVDLLGTDEDGASLFFEGVRKVYSEYAAILSYELPPQRTLESIELEAKSRIIELTMSLHETNAEITEENIELKDMAYIDPLTQLGNRRRFNEVANAELDRCKRTDRSMGILVLDIDFFKKVNDCYGHAVGDAVLAGVANTISHSVRSYDQAFRFGGEEFVVVLAETDAETIVHVAERIRSEVEIATFECEGKRIRVTVSIGGAIFEGSPMTVGEIFDVADRAVYEAKNSGRNRVIVHSTADQPS